MLLFRILLIIVFPVLISSVVQVNTPDESFDENSSMPNISLKPPVVLATESRFSSKTVEVGKKIPFKTRVEYDNEKDACSDDEVIQEGKIGRKTKEYLITYYDRKEYSRELIAVRTDTPVEKIIKKGLKKVYKSMQTDSGTINYWCKLGEFTATAYDPNCKGCNNTTAIGLKAGFGVVAVDKTVIPLGSSLYITGYGKAIAGDTGGYIKGKRIDLGFDTIGSWWGRRKVEVYLL